MALDRVIPLKVSRIFMEQTCLLILTSQKETPFYRKASLF